MKSIKYPITAINGTLLFSENDKVYVDQIKSVLETRPHERIERPNYGTPSYIFQTIQDSFIIASRIEAALIDQTDAKNVSVQAQYTDSNQLELIISFTGLNSVQNFSLKTIL